MSTVLFPVIANNTMGSSSWPALRAGSLWLTRGPGGVAPGTVSDNTAASLGNTNGSTGNFSAWGSNGVLVAIQSGTTPETWGTSGTETVFFSNPLAAVTISGAISVNVRALENSTMANYGVQAFVYKVPANAGAAVTIGRGGNITEIGTVEATSVISITPTSTSLSTGDGIALVLAWGSAGGTSANAFVANGFYNGLSGGSGDTFITFTETITEAAGIPHQQFDPVPFVGVPATPTRMR